jgi:D-tyrosyl-tRNA(Tyr) deacylase
MLALIQRVSRASVAVADRTVGEIGAGLLVFACAEPPDTHETALRLAARLLKLRVFADDAGRMNRSVQDTGGGVLLVSQFTLAADTSGGNRPSFTGAAPAGTGRARYDELLAALRAAHAPVAAGVFGADMQVSLVNDGPVTIPLTIR